MHWSNVGLLVVAGFDLVLALIALAINRKHIVNRLFFLSHFGLAFWALGLAFFREATDLSMAWFWAVFQNVFSGTAFVPFLLLTVYFPYQKYILQSWHKVIITLSIASLLTLNFIPGWWISGIVLSEHDNFFRLNPIGFGFFSLIFFTFVGLGIYNLFAKYISTDGFTRTQAYYFLVGYSILTLVSAIVGVGRSLITLESGFLWVVPYFVIPINLLALDLVFFKKYSVKC